MTVTFLETHFSILYPEADTLSDNETAHRNPGPLKMTYDLKNQC
jgi:hypothetical protein